MKISEQRKTLRRALRKARLDLPRWKRQQAESRIIEQGLSLIASQQSKRIAGYLATGSECSITDLLYLLNLAGHDIYLPQVQPQADTETDAEAGADHTMRFIHWRPHSKLYNNQYRIPEPRYGATCAAEQLDLVFVPLLGWDKTGNRLGAGAGYYDRCFDFRRTKPQSKRPVLCGIGFRCQQVDSIPNEDWDVPLDYLLTA